MLVERAQEVVEVAARGRRTGAFQPKSRKTCSKHSRESSAVRVVAAVDRRVGVDVLGRHRGAHEDQVVVGVGAPQDPRDHRVEERLGELGLRVVDEQADVDELRLLPDRESRATRRRTRRGRARRTRRRARRRSGSAPARPAAPRPRRPPRSAPSPARSSRGRGGSACRSLRAGPRRSPAPRRCRASGRLAPSRRNGCDSLPGSSRSRSSRRQAPSP